MALKRAIGLMSGTSMDGIDVAMIESDGLSQVKAGPSLMVSYEPEFRNRIAASLETAKKINARMERPGDLASLEHEITLRHAKAIDDFCLQYSIDKASIECVGFHGQTVLHRPERGLTVQLGDGKLLARNSALCVVYDMRHNDMLHGGQGAPLVPVYHDALMRNLPPAFGDKKPVAFVNIGGISNITYCDGIHDPIAFDCGPGNGLIDQWVQAGAGVPFDCDGEIASKGQIIASVVENYLSLDFFLKKVPKSLDRNDFSIIGVKGLELGDGARTLAHITAKAIYASHHHFPSFPKLWILCGGGRYNRHIVQDLKNLTQAHDSTTILADECGFNGDSMEAEAWGYLALRAINATALTFPTTTGCTQPVSGGIVYPDT